MIRITVITTATLAFCLPAFAADKPDPKAIEFFEARIRPILATNCVGCHGAEKQKGGLRLDTREGLLAGATEDKPPKKVVEPGSPERSLMMTAVEYKDEDLQMPPPKKKESRKLPQDQIDALREWIKLGVPYGQKAVEPAK